MRNLLVFWLGGITTGIAVALVVLVALHDFALSVVRVVASAMSRPIVAHAQVAIGVLALQIAVLIAAHYWARQRTPALVTGASPSVAVREPNTPAGSGRPSIRGRLERGSLVVAFAAGMAMATPPVEYLGAIVAILASRAGSGAQVSAALMFTVVSFAIAEIPLISCLATPAKTQAVLVRLHEWIGARRQVILAVIVGVCGVLMVVAGTGV